MTEEMSKKKTDGNAPLQATGGFKMTFPKPENFNLAIFSPRGIRGQYIHFGCQAVSGVLWKVRGEKGLWKPGREDSIRRV